MGYFKIFVGRIPFAASFTTAATVLVVALWFQYVKGLTPCPLCLYQRWPWGIAMGIALVGIVQPMRWLWPVLMLVMLASSGLAFYHMGVEYGWWSGLSSCEGDFSAASVDDLMRQLEAAPVVRCDEIPWQFLGLSMAGWNGVLSLALAGKAAYVYWYAARNS
jgi:disulfide bond formation protein DsbB